jgi:pimeloyl-ACP methyl ester carboxylesterase
VKFGKRPLSTNSLKTKGLTEIARSTLLEQYANPNDRSRIIKFKNYEIHVRDNESSNKPILLALHGICDSLHTWDPWVLELEKHFHFIRIDLPYFGLSKNDPETSLSKDYYNNFLDHILDELNIQKFSILGHSLGAYISWNYAVHRPKRIQRIVLLAPPGYPQPVPQVVSLATKPLMKKLGLIWTPKIILKPILNNLFFDKSIVKQEMIDRYYSMLMCEGNRKNYSDLFSFVIKYAHLESDDLQKIDQPTLILWGKNDLWVPSKKAAPYFKEMIPHAEIKLYEKMRHMPQYEQTKETLNELLAFFELPGVD